MGVKEIVVAKRLGLRGERVLQGKAGKWVRIRKLMMMVIMNWCWQVIVGERECLMEDARGDRWEK